MKREKISTCGGGKLEAGCRPAYFFEAVSTAKLAERRQQKLIIDCGVWGTDRGNLRQTKKGEK